MVRVVVEVTVVAVVLVVVAHRITEEMCVLVGKGRKDLLVYDQIIACLYISL